DIALEIDETAVQSVGENRVLSREWLSGRYQGRIAPSIDHVADLIEFNHRRSRLRLIDRSYYTGDVGAPDSFGRGQTAGLKTTRHHKNMVLRGGAGSSYLTGHPEVGQWPHPIGIDGVAHRWRHKPSDFASREQRRMNVQVGFTSGQAGD